MKKKAYNFDEDDHKIDQMAKRLNSVLNNISEKERKLSSYTLKSLNFNDKKEQKSCQKQEKL